MAPSQSGAVTWRGLRWLGVVAALLVAGLAFYGGNFAHGYVTTQLKQEQINMPTAASVQGLPPASQDALKPYYGQEMTTGPQAQAYANHYIWIHMQEACANVTAADGSKVAPIPENQCSYAGIGAAAKTATDPNAKAAYSAMRTSTMFTGDTLRGLLLGAYGWWMLGTIALWVAWAALIGAVLLVLWNLFSGRKAKP